MSSEFPPQPGGIGNHAYHLSHALCQNGYKVTVISDQRSNEGEEERSFDALQPFEVIRIKLRAFRLLMYLKRIQVTFRSFKDADFVIATGKFSLWNVAFLSPFRMVKYLAIIHGSEVNYKSFVLRKSIDLALKRMDKTVAVSNFTKALVSHLREDCHVIPNGIALKEWEVTGSTEDILGNPALTTVGRVRSRKGQLNVIRHLPHLIKEFPDIHYHCIGIPSEAKAFTEEAKALGVEQFITFHGSMEFNRLKNKLSATDVFVMLSSETTTGDVEGFGIAILEANALGVPAIGSKGCGIEDAIKDGSSGILIDARNTEEFKEALKVIINHRTTYSVEASKWAEQHDWSNIIKQYIKLLD